MIRQRAVVAIDAKYAKEIHDVDSKIDRLESELKSLYEQREYWVSHSTGLQGKLRRIAPGHNCEISDHSL